MLLLAEVVLAMLAGLATAYQPGVNAKIAAFSTSKLHGGVVNFAVGLMAMVMVSLLARTPLPEPARVGAAPWWAWCGGLLGAFFVTMAIVLVPRMGAAPYLAAMIAGQLIGSVVIDHFGQMGLAIQTVTWGRAVGVVLVLAGVGCIRWL